MEFEQLQRAIEAILFAAGERMDIARLSAVLETDPSEIEQAADALADKYAYERRGIRILKLENGYRADIGEETLTEEQQEALQQAIREGKITFFLARRGYRAVGMCSVACSFSTFGCAQVAALEDVFVEPVFRRKGIARMLAQAAQSWCRERGVSSLTVCCAPCDEGMYQALGFSERLGTTFAFIP